MDLAWIIILIVYGLVFGFACNYLAVQKNKDGTTWFIVGFLLGIIGLLIIGFAKDESLNEISDAIHSIDYIETNSTIKSEPIIWVDMESPVEVLKQKIIIVPDNQNAYISILFNNLAYKDIDAISFTVKCYDKFGEPIGTPPENQISFLMQEIIMNNKEFGDEKNYLLKGLESTRQAEILIEKVLYKDKSIWIKGKNKLYKNVEIELITNLDELQELRKNIGNDAICYAKELEIGEAWLCVCGRQNLNTQRSCKRCLRQKESVFDKKNSRNSIIEKISENKLLLEQRRIEDEKKKHLREIEQAEKRHSNKMKLIKLTVISVIAIVSIAIIVKSFNNMHSKTQYMKAQKLASIAKDSRELYNESLVKQLKISASVYNSMGLKSDGTVIAVGDNKFGQCNVSGWTDIIAISTGKDYSIGLRSDGTTVATEMLQKAIGNGQTNVSGWKDIVAISAGSSHALGLKSDGTVLAVGNNQAGQCNVSGWKDIIAISAGNSHSLGLKSDGTVLAVGNNQAGQCNVRGWSGIVTISSGYNHSLGLKSDGTVIATTINYMNYGQSDVRGWKDIVAISAGDNHSLGLKSNGTVVAAGDNHASQSNVSGWSGIVAISAGSNHSLGLNSDGQVVAAGATHAGQSDVSGWVLK